MIIEDLENIVLNNTSGLTLTNGERYFRRGLVKEVSTDIHGGLLDLFGTVQSEYNNEIFNTLLEIDLNCLMITDTQCECDDFYRVSKNKDIYLCKHIVAVFKRYHNILDSRNKGANSENIDATAIIEASEMLINCIDNNLKDKERIKLEVSLTRVNSYRREYYEAEFKIGSNKLYVLKNLEAFINAKKFETELKYGQEFNYNPNKYYFSKEDENVIDFIEEYVSINESLRGNSISGTIYRVVNGKSLMILPDALKRFLNCIKHKEIRFIYDEKTEHLLKDSPVKIINEDIPLCFNLEKKDEGIILKTENDIPTPLNLKGDVFLYNNNIYLPSREQFKAFKLFYDFLKESKEIEFKKDKANEVFNKVLPQLECITNEISLDNTLKESIIKTDLMAEFYFDRNRDKIWCDIKFKYGEDKLDLNRALEKGKFIIRDIKQERKVEKALEDFKFFKEGSKFMFAGDDNDLYNFLNEGALNLKDIGEIYYSDRFKEQRIYKSQSIQGNITETKEGYLEFNFEIGDVEEDEFNSILKAFRNKRRFYKLKNNSFIDLEEEKTLEFINLLDNISGDGKVNSKSIKFHKNKAIFLNEAIDDKGLNFIKGKENVQNIADKIKTLDNIDYKVPLELKATLREYQITGFKWFKTISHLGFGGVLADEMGLGKTIQTIAFLLSEKGSKTLIVTPTSLIYNWKNEFDNFAPTMKVITIYGSKAERAIQIENIDDYDVILTTYGTLRNDFTDYEDRNFDYCIIDEAQNIKNPLAQSSEAVKAIKAKVKFALTGTPIENNLMDLWSIFDFAIPGYLYNKSRFQEKFLNNRDGSFNDLKKFIQPFMIRRLKKDVMTELPEKIEKKFFVEMTKEQKTAYSTFVKDVKSKMENKEFIDNKITVFSYLTKLRQLCLDPTILLDNYTGGSAKIDVAIDLIDQNIQEGHKILLFSQFTTVLKNISKLLDQSSINYSYLDGSTKASDRIKMVNEFNNSKSKNIFLISLKAGGTGLNLTSADVVIHFDPWWNPAIEDQATDRAHRFGQKNVVEVIKLIARGTIEEKVLAMQDSKKELINKVINGELENGSFLKSLTQEELLDLLS